MNSDNKARMKVAALIFLMVNAVVFGSGLVTILSVPQLSQGAFFWIPVVTVGSFLIAPAIAWFLAPALMQRFLQAANPPLAARLSRELETQS